jgi:hypothetical protein
MQNVGIQVASNHRQCPLPTLQVRKFKLKCIIYRIVFFFNKYVCECTAGVDVAVEPNQPLRRGCDKMVTTSSNWFFRSSTFSLICPLSIE